MKERHKMSEFKKWLKGKAPRIGWYGGAKEGWKGAFECIRDKMLPNCHEPMDIYDFIEEELNNSC